MAPSPPRYPLRAPLADFTGREEELTELADKLGPSGAVISGPVKSASGARSG